MYWWVLIGDLLLLSPRILTYPHFVLAFASRHRKIFHQLYTRLTLFNTAALPNCLSTTQHLDLKLGRSNAVVQPGDLFNPFRDVLGPPPVIVSFG